MSEWVDWLVTEERLLAKRWKEGKTLDEIATELPRHSVGAIRSHRDRLKLKRAEGCHAQKIVRTWLRVVEALKDHEGMTMAEIEVAAGISKGMCNRLINEHHGKGLRVANWRIGPRKPSALWALGTKPDAPYPLTPVAQRIGKRKERQLRLATNPFAAAAGLVLPPAAPTGRVYQQPMDLCEEEAA